jgi:hypothetical protein
MMSFLTYITGFLLNFELISIFSNCGHLGYRTALTDTILKGDHPRIISAKFGWDWLSSFRGEVFFNGQNCSILSQKVPKFELYKHNDELFSIYYGIFLWTLNFCLFWPIMQIRKKGTALTDTILKGDHLRIISAKFGWDWLSSFRGEDFF